MIKRIWVDGIEPGLSEEEVRTKLVSAGYKVLDLIYDPRSGRTVIVHAVGVASDAEIQREYSIWRIEDAIMHVDAKIVPGGDGGE
ncbi:hypothetical protein ACVWZP_003802 [Pseudomonas sp. TE36184]